MPTMQNQPKSGRKSVTWVVGLVLFGLWSLPPMVHDLLHLCPVRPDGINQADAVPAFARKYGISCTQCHTAFPTLNAYGRQFKLNGYVRSKGSNEGVLESPDGGLWTDKLFPWGVVVRSRPLDYGSEDTRIAMQGISDVDLFFASGDATKNISVFAEMDANANSNFNPSMGDIQAGYHPYKYFNVLVARRGFFVMDPYQTLSNFGSPTVGNRAIAGLQTDRGGNALQGSLSGDTMDETKQTVAINGQVGQEGLGNVYYALGATADKGDDTGRGPKDGNVRLAFSTPKDNFMIGTFGTMGKEGNKVSTTGNMVQYSKTGVDTMLEMGGLVARGAFLYSFDKDLDAIAAATQPDVERNRSAYAEAMYVINKGDSDAPFLVPLVRANWYEAVNGTRQYSYLTAQLAHYFRSNLKAFVEYNTDLKQDVTTTDSAARAPKDSRWTLQAELGF